MLLDNGGDGLIAARHLKLFGYDSSVYYPKQTDQPRFRTLTHLCEACDVPF